MRIAMISYHTCPLATLGGKDTGGMNVYVRDLTRFLGERGIQVDVFTRSQDEHVPHVLHDLGYGNRVVHVRAGPEIPLLKQELINHIPEFTAGVLEFAQHKDLRYDLIHSHYWMSGLAAQELKSGWGVPMIHMFHTLGVMKQRVARSADEIEGDFRSKKEKEIIKLANRIVVPTPAERVQLQWLYQADVSNVVVIPPGVDRSRFYPIPKDEAKEFIGVPPCERMLLFVGRIDPLKGIDTLLAAIALMRQQGQFREIPFCLAIIGGDPEADQEKMSDEMTRLYELRAQFDLDGMVTFLGKRSQDTLPYYYSAAEAVLVPSQYESFGMVALEAMACGTPVVASQVGGLAFLVQDGVTGYTVPTSDPEALAERLIRLINDPAFRQKLGDQAFEFAKGYGWNIIVGRIADLYLEVFARQSEAKKTGR